MTTKNINGREVAFVEQWKDIPMYDGYYQISNACKVKSLPRTIIRDGKPFFIEGKILSSNAQRYPKVTLRKYDKSKCLNIHKLVALAFVKNPLHKPIVNHIDGNKKNNNYTNLEWVTGSENVIHAYRTGLAVNCRSNKGRFGGESGNAKKILKLNLDDLSPICVYPSCVDAAKGVSAKCAEHIRRSANGRVNQAYGYKWIYLKDFISQNPNYNLDAIEKY